MSLPKVDRQEVLRQIAENRVQAALPPGRFQTRIPEANDRGQDGSLELLLRGESTNMRAALQIKGKERHTLNASGIATCRVAPTNLNYLLANSHCPVYLAYGEKEGTTFFGFARDARQALDRDKPTWFKQETVAIPLPHLLDQQGLEVLVDRVRQEARIHQAAMSHLQSSGPNSALGITPTLPDQYQTFSRMVANLCNEGKHVSAKQAIDSIPALTDEDRAAKCALTGFAQRRLGDLEQAVDSYSEAYDLDANALYLVGKADTLICANRCLDAVDLLEKIADNTNSPRIAVSLASASIGLGRMTTARNYLKRAFQSRSQCGFEFNQVWFTYLMAVGRPLSAARAARLALAHNPTSAPLIESAIGNAVVMYASRREDWARAKEGLNQMKRHLPNLQSNFAMSRDRISLFEVSVVSAEACILFSQGRYAETVQFIESHNAELLKDGLLAANLFTARLHAGHEAPEQPDWEEAYASTGTREYATNALQRLLSGFQAGKMTAERVHEYIDRVDRDFGPESPATYFRARLKAAGNDFSGALKIVDDSLDAVCCNNSEQLRSFKSVLLVWLDDDNANNYARENLSELGKSPAAVCEFTEAVHTQIGRKGFNAKLTDTALDLIVQLLEAEDGMLNGRRTLTSDGWYQIALRSTQLARRRGDPTLDRVITMFLRVQCLLPRQLEQSIAQGVGRALTTLD